MHTCSARSLRNTNGEFYLTLKRLTYAIDVGNLDSLYSSTWLPYTCIGWLNVYSYIAYIVVRKKKPTHSVEYAVYICNAHGIIKSHRFSIILG